MAMITRTVFWKRSLRRTVQTKVLLTLQRASQDIPSFFFTSLFSHEKTFHRVWLKFQQGSLFPALLPNSEVEEILISKSIHKQWALFNFSQFFPLKNFDFMVDWYFEWVCKPSSKLDHNFWMTFAWIEFLAPPPLNFI